MKSLTPHSADDEGPARPAIYSRILAFLLCAALVFAGWQSVRLAWADILFRENTLDSVKRAVSLEAGNAAYHELLGEHLEGLGADPTSHFNSAAQLSPTNALYWIRLSFFHEVQGNYRLAEQELLRADKVNRKFGPSWALMNFYFRRNNQPQFWFWARRAFEISFDDVSAIFRLCWDVSPDWRTTAAVLPPRPELLPKFLTFLLTEGHVADTGPLAQRTAQVAEIEDVPYLLWWCDQAMEKDMPASVATWNILCRRGLVHQKPLSLEKGLLVANGDFSETPIRRVFDWGLPVAEGVSAEFEGESEGASLTLSGAQPEDCELLWQKLPMLAGGDYVLAYQYKTLGSDRTPAVGIHWEISPPAGGKIWAQTDDFKVVPDWTDGQLRFEAGVASSARLTLRYKRPSGSVRWQGKVSLRKVSTRNFR